MAKDENKELIAKLTASQLPAKPAGERDEPIERRESSESPAVRETPVPRETEPREPVKPKELSYLVEFDGKKYTAEELRALKTTAEKYPHLQERYNAALEENKAVGKRPEPPAAPKPITNLEIAQKFDPIAFAMLPELVKENLVESDMAELYPRTLGTMIGQLRWIAEMLTDARTAISILIPHVSEIVTRERGELVADRFTGLLDKLQGSAKEYEILKDEKVRLGFVEYLRELDPEGKRAFGEKGEEFLKRQWFAYNHEAILEAGTAGKGEPVHTDKRLVAGDGSSGRPPAAPRGEKSPMDKMIDSRLGAAH
jgi:hypothetical protein